MTLTLVGLGLGAAEDITIRGLKAVQDADVVLLEIYTSALIDSSLEQLATFLGKSVREADRISVEEQADDILSEAREKRVVLLVAGDPLSHACMKMHRHGPPISLVAGRGELSRHATTHCDLCLRAEQAGVSVEVIHNASIINAIGRTGLQLYRFGEVVSIPFFEKNWTPDSFYDKIVQNRRANLHTLCLLDIKVKERSVENLMANRMVFEPPRYMSVNVAIEQIRQVDAVKHELAASSCAFGVARLGSKTAKIVAGNAPGYGRKSCSGTLEQLMSVDFGGPLHSLVICAPHLHDIEEQYFAHYNCSASQTEQ
ncbi:diphthine synthase, putative [Babesia caballi]|uniref:diphthine methyl ester synthase n=1 Tax=Babesia caballi TaxID=5871 RepID=A0AAV4LYR6_BABCB|nr:diphthine synthase, putative [Babesia caballi]